MTDLTPQEVLRIAARVCDAAPRLRSLGLERRAAAIGQAVALLADGQTALGSELRDKLAQSTGLSPPMIEWGLSTALGSAGHDSLLRAAVLIKYSGRRAPVPARLVAVILAGNVFTAALRAVALPLLAAAPVAAKASSTDDVLARYLKQALNRAEPTLGAGYEVVTFPGDRQELLDALLQPAETAAVYGSDQTIASIRARLGPGTALVEHGHGLGAIYVPASALPGRPAALEVIKRAALDVAAYDQRGCLSPHAILVQKGGALDGAGFARLLAEAGLDPLQDSLPRGPLPVEAAADQMQWRGVAAARGMLFAGDKFAVSYEGDAELRPAPGYRNVGVYDCERPDMLAGRLQVFGRHLKALGVAGDREERERVAGALEPPLAPLISEVGSMQTPALSALADGQDPFAGLVRWIDID